MRQAERLSASNPKIKVTYIIKAIDQLPFSKVRFFLHDPCSASYKDPLNLDEENRAISIRSDCEKD